MNSCMAMKVSYMGVMLQFYYMRSDLCK